MSTLSRSCPCEAGGIAVNDLEVAAEHAVLTGQIRSLVAWVGSGRKLTQTGRIGLVDARHLVALLGTGDTIDPKIGDRVFKTKSSEELAHLTRIVEWAKAARLIRVGGTRLVPVKKNATLPDRPLDLVMAMFEAYPKLGKALFPQGTYRQSLVGDQFRNVSEALVTTMLAHVGPCPLSVLRASASDLIADRYVLDGLGEQQLNFLRRTIDTDVSVAVAALAVLGVASVDEAQDTAELTALGRFTAKRSRGTPLPGEPVLQVRITLLDVADPAGMLGHLEEAKVQLADVAGAGERIGYEYDFGDSWEHELLVEACTKAEAHQAYPACTAGEGACRPRTPADSPVTRDSRRSSPTRPVKSTRRCGPGRSRRPAARSIPQASTLPRPAQECRPPDQPRHAAAASSPSPTGRACQPSASTICATALPAGARRHGRTRT